MKYLKKFENHTQYESAQSNLILPNVSICNDVPNEVHYNPSSPTPSHEFVEIGGVKWATMNVGASSITDGGLLFQWGDTQGYTDDQVGSGEGKKYFGWEDYKYWTADTGSGSSGMTKYNNTDGKTALDASDDAVTAAWGGKWRMPTDDDFNTLFSETTSAFTTNYESRGVIGFVLTSKDDSSKKLFFPTGYALNGKVIYKHYNYGNYVYYGWYLRNRLISSDEKQATGYNFYSTGIISASIDRNIGCRIRGVLDE